MTQPDRPIRRPTTTAPARRSQRVRQMACIGMLAWGLGPAAALAADVAEPPVDGAPGRVDEALTTTRASVRASTEWVARHVDGWFGDKPFADGGGVYDGQISLNMLHRQDIGNDFNVGFNARFRLPNVEDRSYVFIGRDNPDEVIADTPKEFSRRERLLSETSEQRSVFAGLGIALRDAFDLRLGVRGGFKPYAQARYRKVIFLGDAQTERVEFRETFFWSVRDRLGATTALSYEHPFTPTLAFRWLNAATITQASSGWSWSSSAGVLKSLGHRRTLSLEALISGQRVDEGQVSEWGLQTKWQQPVHADWLLGHVILGHFWPRGHDTLAARERGNESSWALGAGLTMLF